MIIRKFDEKDRDGVLKLISQTLYEIFKVKPKKVDIDKVLLKKGGIFYIVEDNGKIIGTIGIKKHKSEVARLKKMYLKKSYRGRGLAQKMYSKAQSFAKKKGYKKIILSTTPQMKAAIKFYQKMGFVKYRVNKRLNQIFFSKNIYLHVKNPPSKMLKFIK
ncbi:GNAT family N-acetyltransferase [Candidatus Woesearchaeota archaeon]|nr:GNAT family N-acetyltransferase [Candidatus Woesearchaeota archaeon]